MVSVGRQGGGHKIMEKINREMIEKGAKEKGHKMEPTTENAWTESK